MGIKSYKIFRKYLSASINITILKLFDNQFKFWENIKLNLKGNQNKIFKFY